MRKIFFAAMLVVCLTGLATAQSNNKYEGFAGFSIASFDTGLANSGLVNGNNHETALGFETSATGYLTDHLGIEGDFDGHFKHKDFTFVGTGTTVGVRLSSFNFMGGPHYRFSSSGKITPFVRALFGGNHSSVSNGSFTSPGGVFVSGVGASETDFAMKLGGGVDIGWTKRAAFRIGADYNPIFQKSGGNLNPNFGSSRTRNDVVVSFGIVFK